MWLYLLPIFFSLAAAATTNPSFKNTCASAINTLRLPNTTVWTSSYVSAGTNLTFPDTNETCAQGPQLVSANMCRITMYVATSARSSISMEAWLPETWTGRFLSTGNGGLSGCIQYYDMAYGQSLGFATVGANSGHNGTSGEPFYRNEDVVIDFAWRSVHTNVIIGKGIVRQFYGQKQKKSYYLGCSTGGRQGIKSVQMFPHDFDGVVAGAPAVGFNNLTSWSGKFFLETGPLNSPTFVTLQQWFTIIAQDVMAQCDHLDGVIDNIIEDPLLCNYNPENLICPPSSPPNTTTCLTPTQAHTVRQIFSPLYGTNNNLIFPRMQPGSEPNGAPAIYYNGLPFPYTADWFRYAVYQNPTWDPATLNAKDFDNAYVLNPGDVQSWNGDLGKFRNAGGKLLHYHGLADPVITSENSPRYYEHVSKTMNLPPHQMDDFYRFFRISGMAHCQGGTGAWAIGQSAPGFTTAEPEDNVLMAVVAWVEGGVAPERVRGVRWVNDTRGGAVERVRGHCRWPFRSTYLGGVAGEEGSWGCV